MTYGAAAALQAAVYAALTGHPDLAAVPVLDAVPPGGGTGTFVLIGPEEARDASDKSGAGAEHRLEISVLSDAAGFLAAKAAAVAVCAAMQGVALPAGVGRLVGVEFVRAVARRLEDGAVRRIDLRFRVRVEF